LILTGTFAFALFFVSLLHAQRSVTPPPGARGVPGSTTAPSNPQSPFTIPSMQTTFPRASMAEDEACLPWAVSAVRGATVSVARLGVPSKARSDFEKACSDFKKKKLPEAEQHFRDA